MVKMDLEQGWGVVNVTDPKELDLAGNDIPEDQLPRL